MNLPNILTLLRIGVIPIFVAVFYLPYSWSNEVVATLFALAAATDWLDGFLARRLNQQSAFGAFLDPVADKLMVSVALVMLVSHNPSPWYTIPAIIIIGREIAISALREWMAEIGASMKVSVKMIGKVKTSAQMTAVFLLLYQEPISGFPTQTAGELLLYLAAILTLWSMFIYLRAAWPSLREK